MGCEEHTVPGWFRGQDNPEEAEGQVIWGLDLGYGVFAAPYTAYKDEGGDHVGAFIWHTHDDGQLCGGGVRFAPNPDREGGGPVWAVESWWPLTITPSVLCRGGPGGVECLHGFITDGRWVSC